MISVLPFSLDNLSHLVVCGHVQISALISLSQVENCNFSVYHGVCSYVKKLLLLQIVELSMFAFLSKREWKKPCSRKITSHQLMSKVNSYTKDECWFWGG